MILDKESNSEDMFQHLVNVLTEVHHPNLELFVGVYNPEFAVITRRNGKKHREFFRTIKKHTKSTKNCPLCSKIIDKMFNKRITFPEDENSPIIQSIYY